MFRPSLIFILLSCAAFSGELRAATPPVAATPITVPVFGPRFKEIHERIDVLYRNRNGSYPLPDPQLNVFRTVAEKKVATATPKDPTPAEKIDADTILRQAVMGVKGGIITDAEGAAFFFANQKRYREGDIIMARFRDKPVTLVIKRVTITNVTFGFENAEITVSANQLR